jgi:hypothetical protein
MPAWTLDTTGRQRGWQREALLLRGISMTRRRPRMLSLHCRFRRKSRTSGTTKSRPLPLGCHRQTTTITATTTATAVLPNSKENEINKCILSTCLAGRKVEVVELVACGMWNVLVFELFRGWTSSSSSCNSSSGRTVGPWPPLAAMVPRAIGVERFKAICDCMYTNWWSLWQRGVVIQL